MLGVFIAQKRALHRDAPVYAQRFIQDAYAAIGLGMVELITLVLEHGNLTQYGKSVGKAFGYEELAFVLFTQFYCYVLTVGGASFADIYGYVQHGSLNATQQFALGEWGALEMEASHYTVGGHAFVVLDKPDFVFYQRRYLGVKVSLGKTFKEVATGIVKHLWLNYQGSLKWGFNYIHFSANFRRY